MSGASFNTALDRLVVLIEQNTALQNFALAKWQKRFTVKRVFKPGIQINATELPLIMITRPEVSKESLIGGGRENKNTVRFYVRFQQPDAEKAQAEIVEVEEKIDDCLEANYRIKNTNGDPLVKSVKPGDSANDEGVCHPTYNIVMDAEIEHRRNT